MEGTHGDSSWRLLAENTRPGPDLYGEAPDYYHIQAHDKMDQKSRNRAVSRNYLVLIINYTLLTPKKKKKKRYTM